MSICAIRVKYLTDNLITELERCLKVHRLSKNRGQRLVEKIDLTNKNVYQHSSCSVMKTITPSWFFLSMNPLHQGELNMLSEKLLHPSIPCN